MYYLVHSPFLSVKFEDRCCGRVKDRGFDRRAEVGLRFWCVVAA